MPRVAAQVESARGAEEEFTAFFVVAFPALAAYCASLTADVALGEEMAQEALVRTWTRWVRVRRPRAYAYLVATNLARRHWRDSASSAARVRHDDTVASTAEIVALRDLVERLPERLRVPVLLHYYADLPISDVAALMRRPAGTVKRRLHEARALLVDQYQES